MRLWPGRPYPLGATYDGTGTNFSVFSGVAETVELCLFDNDGTEASLDLGEVDALAASLSCPSARVILHGAAQ
jgi:glycogen operon protein